MTTSMDSTGTQNSLVWGMRPYNRLARGGIGDVVSILVHVPLRPVPDEAYFWVWSKHFALCYRDKGPLVAWTIALGTRLFGDTVLGVRFFAVLLSAATAFQLFQLARRLYDDRAALWCLVVAASIPLFAIGAILMTIDPLSVFFRAWGANLSWRAYDTGRMRSWLLLERPSVSVSLRSSSTRSSWFAWRCSSAGPGHTVVSFSAGKASRRCWRLA